MVETERVCKLRMRQQSRGKKCVQIKISPKKRIKFNQLYLKLLTEMCSGSGDVMWCPKSAEETTSEQNDANSNESPEKHSTNETLHLISEENQRLTCQTAPPCGRRLFWFTDDKQLNLYNPKTTFFLNWWMFFI